jgi:hypothetical protein
LLRLDLVERSSEQSSSLAPPLCKPERAGDAKKSPMERTRGGVANRLDDA